MAFVFACLTVEGRCGIILKMSVAQFLQLFNLFLTLLSNPIYDVAIANLISKSHAFVVSLSCRHIIHMLII